LPAPLGLESDVFSHALDNRLERSYPGQHGGLEALSLMMAGRPKSRAAIKNSWYPLRTPARKLTLIQEGLRLG
jgi:hypothetical protein